jgi:hypothetical protein
MSKEKEPNMREGVITKEDKCSNANFQHIVKVKLFGNGRQWVIWQVGNVINILRHDSLATFTIKPKP